MKGKFAVLIFNPKSGKGKARERAIDFSQKWKDIVGTEIRLRPTSSLADIQLLQMKPTMIKSYKSLWVAMEHFRNRFRVFPRNLILLTLQSLSHFFPAEQEIVF